MSISVQFFFNQVKLYAKEISLGTFLLIATNGLGVYIPLLIKSLIDNLVKNNLKIDQNILFNLSLVIILALLMAGIRTASRIVLFGIGRRVESEQKQNFYEHLLKLDLAYFSTQRIGDLISRATNDILAIRQMMGFGLLNIVNIVWVYLLTLPIMFKLNASLTFYILLGYLPIFMLVRHLSLQLKTKQIEAQEQLGSLSSFIEEDLNGIQVIKSYSQETREIERFEKVNNKYLNTSTELARWRGIIWPIMELARGISFFILLFYVSKGLLSAGTIAAFLIYLERLLFPTAIMGWLITIFQRGAVSVQRIKEVFDEKAHIIDNSANPALIVVKEANIKIQNLDFQFPDTEQKALNNLNIEIKGGKFVGIVGLIGSGKSTLANALMRLIDIKPNSIFIDEQDINNYSLSSLRQSVALIPQETFLFNKSIKDNILLGSGASEEEMIKASEIAQIHTEISKMPEAYNTLVGEKGVSLSGGQAQRIALARAIIKKPRILILDDALSSVDNEIGLKILNELQEYLKEQKQTLILITHRISSLRQAEQIYIIEKGACIESGNSDYLLKNSEIYQKLWKKQLTVNA